MCKTSPGERCASDTRVPAVQTLEEYVKLWPGWNTPNPLDTADCNCLPISTPAPEPEAARLAQQVADAQRRYDLLATEHLAAASEYNKPRRGDQARNFAAADQNLVRVSGNLSDARTALRRAKLDQRFSSRQYAPDLETFGSIHASYGPFPAEDAAWNEPSDSVNEVRVGDSVFQRHLPGERQFWDYDGPEGIRIEANRELSNNEMRHLTGLVGYAQRSELRGYEPISHAYRDGPNSFVVYQDPTKSSSDDIGMAYERFEDALPRIVSEGTAIRKTNRAGAGTKDTRAIEGLPGVEISIWYAMPETD
jgi:hypothetical protein